MPEKTDAAFIGSIPEVYDDFLVPLIFETYAADLARRVAELGPSVVLETAAGSGVLPRALAPLLAATTRYVITDLNSPMLERAQARQADRERLEWRQADALQLPFDDASFDVVVCQFGVMFFPDRVAGLREARRVLKPDGTLLFNVWGELEANEFANDVTTAVAALFPDDPPSFLARIPHGYFDDALIGDELALAGFAEVEINTLEATSTAPSPRHAAIAYCQGTPLRNEIELRPGSDLEAATTAAAQAITKRFGTGPVAGKICGHVVAARGCR